MSPFLADENFPHPSFRLISTVGIDISHVSFDLPSISDITVLRIVRDKQRVLLTLDADYGELIF
jgi:predicted nuclease of predicted toxin-antitoxin system